MDHKNQRCFEELRDEILRVYGWFKKANVDLDRSVLANLAVSDRAAFADLVAVSRDARLQG